MKKTYIFEAAGRRETLRLNEKEGGRWSDVPAIVYQEPKE